jgi:hypothetical protein
MDRQMVYAGQIPLETDILSTNKDGYIGLAKLAAGVLGTTTLLNGGACTPTSPASMQVQVAAVEIYSLQNIDNTAYSSLAADTTHQIVKQGINLNTTTLSCPAPATVGNSINYLIQYGFSETDGGSTVLPYYNASNPSQAWSGPNNSGQANNTIRQNTVNVQVKAGVSAPTGTQTTPSPDTGFVGGYVVTVAQSATTITSGNISLYSGAPFITETLTQKISQTTADARYTQQTQVQSGALIYATDTSGAANTVTASLSPAITSYTAGLRVNIKIANTNTGASTVNINGLGAKTIVKLDGTALAAGDIAAGMIAILVYDGTNFQLVDVCNANYVTQAQVQSGASVYAASTTAANTYTATLSPSLAAYTAGMRVFIKFTNANTSTTPTINLNSLGAITITRNNGNALQIGDIAAGMIALLAYDGTNFQLLNPFNDLSVQTANLVIGGEFGINPWQRGISFTAVANNKYTADRFKYIASGTGVVTIAKASDAPTVAQAGIYTTSCLQISVTTAATTINAGDFYGLRHCIEGYTFLPIAQKTFTVSFWVKSPITGTHCLSLMNSGSDRSYIAEYTINSANTWEYKTLTISASPSAGTWVYDNGGAGIVLTWTLAAGSTYQTTAGSWATGNYLASANQVNVMNSNTNVFKIQLIQVEPGVNATPFKARPPQQEWALCQRYYEKSYNFDTYAGAITLVSAYTYHCPQTNVTQFGFNPRFAVAKRTTPTVTYYSTSTGTSGKIFNNATSSDQTVSSLTGTGANSAGYLVLTANATQADSLFAHFIADAEI